MKGIGHNSEARVRELTDQFKTHHNAVLAFGRKSVAEFRAGAPILADLREEVPRGQWEAHCQGMGLTPRWAQDYRAHSRAIPLQKSQIGSDFRFDDCVTISDLVDLSRDLWDRHEEAEALAAADREAEKAAAAEREAQEATNRRDEERAKKRQEAARKRAEKQKKRAAKKSAAPARRAAARGASEADDPAKAIKTAAKAIKAEEKAATASSRDAARAEAVALAPPPDGRVFHCDCLGLREHVEAGGEPGSGAALEVR